MVFYRQDAQAIPQPTQIHSTRKASAEGQPGSDETRFERAPGVAHYERFPGMQQKRAARNHFAFVHVLMVGDQYRRAAIRRQMSPLTNANFELEIGLAHDIGGRQHRPVRLHLETAVLTLRTASTASDPRRKHPPAVAKSHR